MSVKSVTVFIPPVTLSVVLRVLPGAISAALTGRTMVTSEVTNTVVRTIFFKFIAKLLLLPLIILSFVHLLFNAESVEKLLLLAHKKQKPVKIRQLYGLLPALLGN
ncbi:hypothetical protein D3C77_615290 [compost metagenome]